MNPVYRFSWLLWIVGCALVVGSWVNAVPMHIGWAGFGVALAGTLLSMVSTKLSSRAGDGSGNFLCDRCRLNHENACWRPERPNAVQCPDYQPMK